MTKQSIRYGGNPTKIQPAVGAVILDDKGRVLLQRRADNGLWGIVGGRVKVGESVEKAVRREVMEETGIRVDIVRFVGVYSEPKPPNIVAYENGRVVHYISLLFLCKAITHDLHANPESLDLRYFVTDRLPSDMVPDHASRIADALSYSETHIILR